MTCGAAEVRLPPGGTAQEAALRHVAVAEDVVEEGEANTTPQLAADPSTHFRRCEEVQLLRIH